MNIFINYDEPTKKDMLVILPFFNPANSIRIIQNILFVYSKLLVAKIPVILAHCIFPNDFPILPECDNYLILRSNSYAFVKENITTIAIKKNLEKYNKFLMLDGDIIFSSSDWYSRLSNKLDNYDIVHPYQEMCYLNPSYLPARLSYPSVIYKKGGDSKQGFGMAFTKDYFESIGLPEECLIGGGDVNLLRIIDKDLQQPPNELYSPIVEKYKNKFRPIKYSYLENEKIFHLYHNELKNRQYISRHDILRRFVNGATIFDIVERNSDGIYEWIPQIKDKINIEIKKYFNDRNDDSI